VDKVVKNIEMNQNKSDFMPLKAMLSTHNRKAILEPEN
jgi:hypothetical protein